MPNKIIDKFENIYIANINNNLEYTLFTKLFLNAKFILSNLLFGLLHISKSTYIFDLIVICDVLENITLDLIQDLKTNIMNQKGEIWVLCDNKKINNIDKVKYVETLLDNTNYRSSIIQFDTDFSMVIIK